MRPLDVAWLALARQPSPSAREGTAGMAATKVGGTRKPDSASNSAKSRQLWQCHRHFCHLTESWRETEKSGGSRVMSFR